MKVGKGLSLSSLLDFNPKRPFPPPTCRCFLVSALRSVAFPTPLRIRPIAPTVSHAKWQTGGNPAATSTTLSGDFGRSNWHALPPNPRSSAVACVCIYLALENNYKTKLERRNEKCSTSSGSNSKNKVIKSKEEQILRQTSMITTKNKRLNCI